MTVDGGADLTGLVRYRVGGCVRDALLGLPVGERDWVVLDETPQGMVARGFRQVGASFPVFLHPVSGEEHALARTERKQGRGYKGFVVNSAPGISLEQDLGRRDLTINAMAMDDRERLIDPYGGMRDLGVRCLRHVSAAFAEDPLRVLRVARFRARFATLGFVVAGETEALMARIVRSGELHDLPVERVWLETRKALETSSPAEYFRVLDSCGALAVLFPELEALKGKRHDPRYHPEGDAFAHMLWTLERAAQLTCDPEVRFAALVHDLGKGMTPVEQLPHHYGHDQVGEGVVAGLCARLKLPRRTTKLAVLVAGQHMRCHRALEMRPGKVVGLLERLDALHHPEQLERVLVACAADARRGDGEEGYPAGKALRAALRVCRAVDATQIVPTAGQGMAARLRQERIRRLCLWRQRGGVSEMDGDV